MADPLRMEGVADCGQKEALREVLGITEKKRPTGLHNACHKARTHADSIGIKDEKAQVLKRNAAKSCSLPLDHEAVGVKEKPGPTSGDLNGAFHGKTSMGVLPESTIGGMKL